MNIHEHQAKEILKKYGAPVSHGVVIFNLEEIEKKINELKSKEFVLKAQIHAGGRGKAGGVKLIKNKDELKEESKKMLVNAFLSEVADSIKSNSIRNFIKIKLESQLLNEYKKH